ncbi:MAG: DEAD/DEAH box helicase [Gemmatimonadetes bacterium]|nr:DEAD/DEAH box helicase [Gemmatimonadota bacterium]
MPSRPAPLADLPPLPIDAVMGRIVAALEHQGAVVVVAPPGAGKTTRIPLALLDAPWRGESRILVLEPRRLAARAAATQMARLLGEPVGQTVGYRVRHDSKVSARTRIEVVTEGILTRMLQEDPGLDGVAALCFDEFHERHLTTDLGLALALESRAVLREDLRLVVMSATLDPAPVAAQLGDAPVIVSEGRAFIVETSWRPVREGIALPLAVAQGIREHWTLVDGDCLVFLPGIAEIRRTELAIIESPPSGPHQVQILHGSLALEEQDAVLRPRGAVRRIILSTAIAESSVTLEGVRMVVDAGRSRVPRFDPRSGMTRLTTVKVSQQSAARSSQQISDGDARDGWPPGSACGSGAKGSMPRSPCARSRRSWSQISPRSPSSSPARGSPMPAHCDGWIPRRLARSRGAKPCSPTSERWTPPGG